MKSISKTFTKVTKVPGFVIHTYRTITIATYPTTYGGLTTSCDREIFSALDQDGDGAITEQEFVRDELHNHG
jgi:hypothetical protein